MLGYGCDRNLWLIESIVETFQAQGWSHGWTAGPSNFSLVCFYSGLLLCLNIKTVSRRGPAVVLFGFAWLVMGWWLPAKVASWRSDEAVTCTFVDVGHGTGVLLQLPDGQNWLYDAGSLGAADFGATKIAGVLWHEHIQHLDTVVVSHADVDHFNSLARLAEQFPIGRLLISKTMLNSSSNQAQRLIRKFESMGIPVCSVDRGDQWDAGPDAKISVLAPVAAGFDGDDNVNSIVLLVDSGGRRLLLPGDLEREGLDFLLSQPGVDCDVVMAAHHGSPHSHPPEFMDWATPEWVVISGGSKRVSNETSQRFLEPAVNRHVLRTDQSGAVKIRLDAAQVTVQHWETDRWVRCD